MPSCLFASLFSLICLGQFGHTIWVAKSLKDHVVLPKEWHLHDHLLHGIKKLKTSYNGALRRLLLIKKPYSASTMFVTHGIPSFFELLRKCIYNFSQQISLSSNSIIVACLAPSVFIHSPVRQWWRSVLY